MEMINKLRVARDLESQSNNDTVIKIEKTPTEYEMGANKYLSRFKGSPMTGRMLDEAHSMAMNKYNIDVPLELSLSQGQFESHFGTDKNPNRDFINNPYNVGAEDEGNKQSFKSTQDGVNAYYDLMARKYLNKARPEDLTVNFVNDDGKRYASDPDYESKIRNQMDFVKKYIGKIRFSSE